VFGPQELLGQGVLEEGHKGVEVADHVQESADFWFFWEFRDE
jgi:hypothetical protein